MAIYNRPMLKPPHLGWIIVWILAVLLAGCLTPQRDAPRAAPFTQTPAPPTLTATQTPTLTAIPAPTLTMSSTPTPEPAGGLRPRRGQRLDAQPAHAGYVEPRAGTLRRRDRAHRLCHHAGQLP